MHIYVVAGFNLWKENRNLAEVARLRKIMETNAGIKRAEYLASEKGKNQSKKKREQFVEDEKQSLANESSSLGSMKKKAKKKPLIIDKFKDNLLLLFDKHGECRQSFVFRKQTFVLWWPQHMKRQQSPLTYTSDLQRTELLSDSVPLSALIRLKGKVTTKVYMINTALKVKQEGGGGAIYGKFIYNAITIYYDDTSMMSNCTCCFNAYNNICTYSDYRLRNGHL